MAVRTDKTDLIADLAREIDRATTVNRISPMEMFDILQSIIGLLLLTPRPQIFRLIDFLP